MPAKTSARHRISRRRREMIWWRQGRRTMTACYRAGPACYYSQPRRRRRSRRGWGSRSRGSTARAATPPTQPRNFCRECRLGLGAALDMVAVPAADRDIADRAAGAPAAAAYVVASSGTSTSTKPRTAACATSAPMSLPKLARLAWLPLPEPGLKCPRCDSTNTKFCYFNNYSLTQPRHFCHTCRRYWTRGGSLCNVPVGGGYSCHDKRRAKRSSAKSKASAGEPAAAAGTASSALTATTPNTTSCTVTAPPGLHQYSMFCTKSESPHRNRFADNFNPASLNLGSPNRLLFADGGVYHQPVLQGMFHLGLQSGGGGNCEEGASSTTT